MKITVKTGTIGPRHDPYGTTLITVANAANLVEHYSDGLGQLTVKVNGKEEVSSRFAIDDGPEQDLAARVFEQYAGISVQAAREAWETSQDHDSWYDRASRYC